MDFVTRLLYRLDLGYCGPNNYVNTLLPIKTSDTAKDYAKFYMHELVILDGVPLSIMLERGNLFTSQFWQSF